LTTEAEEWIQTTLDAQRRMPFCFRQISSVDDGPSSAGSGFRVATSIRARHRAPARGRSGGSGDLTEHLRRADPAAGDPTNCVGSL
jgi:hypothetical protein